jgi:hypothetical protein
MQAVPYITWLTPCILITALVACAATLLELRYQKLVRSGAYNPKTCTLSGPKTALPLARVRTHRCVGATDLGLVVSCTPLHPGLRRGRRSKCCAPFCVKH